MHVALAGGLPLARTATRSSPGRRNRRRPALIFKLHPNENAPRAIREIGRLAPGAAVFTTGSAEEMIANCDVLVTRFSIDSVRWSGPGQGDLFRLGIEEMRRLIAGSEPLRRLQDRGCCRGVLQESRP